MKRKTVIIIVIIVVVIILAISAWIIYKNFVKKDDIQDLGDGGYEPPITPPSGVSYSSINFPITKGMSGPEVTTIQDSLNKKCKSNLSIDGKFGPKTESALKSCYGVSSVNQSLFTQMKSDSGSPISGMPVATGGYVSNQKVFLKGTVSNIYSYPSFDTNYIVGSVEKSFFLDKPIGLYIGGATGGFSKVRVYGYKPYGATSYKVETKDVYISTTALSKTPY